MGIFNFVILYEKEAVWEEIEKALQKFETGNGFIGPCEMLVELPEKNDKVSI